MRQLDAVAERQLLQVVRQLIGARHAGVVNEHRDHRDIALQRAPGFEPDEVGGVVQPAPACGIGDGEPVLADHREQHAAGGDLLLDRAPEVAARLDAGHVHEHRALAEAIAQVLEQAPRVALRVVAPVADEDRAHSAPSRSAALTASGDPVRHCAEMRAPGEPPEPRCNARGADRRAPARCRLRPALLRVCRPRRQPFRRWRPP